MPTLPEIGENERALAVRAEDAARNLPVVLRSQEDYEHAGARLTTLRGIENTLDNAYEDFVLAPQRERKVTWAKWLGEPARVVKEGVKQLKHLMDGYLAEQEALRKAEEAKLKARAEADAARDKAKLEAKAAAEREKADELRSMAEAEAAKKRARLQAEADALKSKRDAASRVARAELEARAKAVEADTTKADAKAADAAAHERQAEITTAVDVRVESKVQPVAGIRQQVVWKFRVVDFRSLPDTYKLPNDVLLGSIARSDKAEAKIPGVEFYPESVLAARGS